MAIRVDDADSVYCYNCDSSLEKHVREIVHKAFWEKLAEELNQDPPNYTQALALIADVKQVWLAAIFSQIL